MTPSDTIPRTGHSAFHLLVKSRRSVRAYLPDPVEEEKISQIMDAMMSAPSAGNLQSYKVVLVRDQARKRALVEAAEGQAFLEQAPVVLVFFAHPDHAATKYHHRWADLFAIQDATVACAYAQLAAADLGLGTVWVGSFHDDAVSHALHADPEWRPVVLLPAGYPAENPAATTRRALVDVVRGESKR